MSNQFIHPSAQVDPAASIYENTIIGPNCQVGPEVVISVNVRIEKDTRIFGKVNIGPCVHIGASVTIVGPLEIKRDVHIGDHAEIGVVVAADSPLAAGLIGKGARIGEHAIVLGKLEIGEFAFVRPGSRLQGDLPQHAVAAGSPASLVDFICECGQSYHLQLLPSGVCVCQCPACGAHYQIHKNLLNRRGRYLLPGQQAGQITSVWEES